MPTHFGQTVRMFRKRLKLSQEQLAVAMNLSRNTITSMEQGKDKPTSDSWAFDYDALLKALQTSREDFESAWLNGLVEQTYRLPPAVVSGVRKFARARKTTEDAEAAKALAEHIK